MTQKLLGQVVFLQTCYWDDLVIAGSTRFSEACNEKRRWIIQGKLYEDSN